MRTKSRRGNRSQFNRSWKGPKQIQITPKRSPHNLCDNCQHFRSDHRRSLECKIEGCNCKVMVFG